VVVVEVHEGKDLVDALLGRVFVRRELDHLARHVVNGLDNLEHLVVRDEAVVVDVVQLEGPCWGMNAGEGEGELVGSDGLGCEAAQASRDAHWSFSSSLPRLVMDRAAINSLKSIVPLLFLSARAGWTRVRERSGA